MNWYRGVSAVVGAMVCSMAGAQPQVVELGPVLGTSLSYASGLSRTGDVVVGHYTTPGNPPRPIHAYRWSLGGGVQDLGTLPGLFNSVATGVSADGTVVVGYSYPQTTSAESIGYRAFRWTEQTGMVDIGLLSGGSFAQAAAISADGSTIVGTAGAPVVRHGFKWTQSGGMQDLAPTVPGAQSYATDVSADGSVVVGSTQFGSRPTGTIWAAGAASEIPAFSGALDSAAYGVSGDDRVVVGEGYLLNGQARAYRLTSSGGTQSIGALPLASRAFAQAVSARGTVVVGESGSPQGEQAFIWFESGGGMQNLNTYLAAHGVDMTQRLLYSARAISADSTAIVGAQSNGPILIRNLPALESPACAADFNASGGLSVQDIFDYLGAWFALNPSADFNGASGVTVQDIFDYLEAWFVGCP